MINPVLSVVSLAAVVWSLWRVGAGMAAIYAFSAHVPMPSPAWYTGGLLAFLGAHEFGHWRAARKAGAHPGWPLFWPWPLSIAAWVRLSWLPAFGTLGAWLPIRGFHRLSGPSQWKIAIAGPLYGFGVSVALLAVGVALSAPVTAGPHVWSPLHIPILVAAFVPDGIQWHPFVMAGWLGVLVTGINLLPIPPLDGWYVWSRWDVLTLHQRLGSLAIGGLTCACLL